MSMRNSTNTVPVFVQNRMRGGIRRRAQFSINQLAVKIEDDHFLRRKFVVRDTAGLNRKDAEPAVCGTDVAKCKIDEPKFWKLDICLICRFLYVQIFIHLYRE